MNVQLRGRVPVPGEYVLVVEYASEDQAPQTLTVSVSSPGDPNHQEQITLLHCRYRCDVATIAFSVRPALLCFRFTLNLNGSYTIIL